MMRTTLAPVGLVLKLTRLADGDEVARIAYLTILSRSPSSDEALMVAKHLTTPGVAREELCRDVVWVLIAGAAFRFNHQAVRAYGHDSPARSPSDFVWVPSPWGFCFMAEPVPQPEPPTPEADRLVRLVVSGDTQEFVGLIRLYESDVWRIAATLLRDWGATESLVQQPSIDAYAHLHQYQLGTDFGAWIRTLTRNRLPKELRTLSRAEQQLAVYRERLAGRLRSEEPAHDDSDNCLAALRNCRAWVAA